MGDGSVCDSVDSPPLSFNTMVDIYCLLKKEEEILELIAILRLLIWLVLLDEKEDDKDVDIFNSILYKMCLHVAKRACTILMQTLYLFI